MGLATIVVSIAPDRKTRVPLLSTILWMETKAATLMAKAPALTDRPKLASEIECALVSDKYRIAEPNRTGRSDRGEHADLRFMMLRRGPQDAEVAWQVALAMGGHDAA
jgi:hypothetical protein